MRRAVTRALLALMLGIPAIAGAAMCSVDDLRVTVGSADLDGRLSIPGLQLPVTFDEATGGVTLDLSSFPNTHFQIVGVDSELHFPTGAMFTGTVDAAGNITIPNVQMNLLTHVGDPPTPVDVAPTITTGIHAVTISGKDYPTEGTHLNFADSTLTLAGEEVVQNAPNAGGNISTGLLIHCTLDTVPDPTKLPTEPTLGHPSGDAKLSSTGDSLTLRTIITPGGQTLDPAHDDVFVRLRDASGIDAAYVRVPGGTLTAKGKSFKVTDTDGSKIHVIAGHKTGATAGGSLTIDTTKAGLKVTLDENALDLSSLTTGAATVMVAIGTVESNAIVTVAKKGSKVTFK